MAKITILIKYSNYANIILFKFEVKFVKHNNNIYVIKLKKDRKLFYGSIYKLDLMKLEFLKIYIEITLANSFI